MLIIFNIQFDVLISTIGTIISFILNISPITLFIKIIKESEKYEIVPESMLILNIICGELWFCYWLVLNKFVPMISGGLGMIISIIFGIIYLYYFSNKKKFNWLLNSLFLIYLVYIIYYFFYKFNNNPDLTGKLACFINIITFISPGQNVIYVIQTGKYNYIPIYTTFFGVICCIFWLIYGLIVWDFNCIVTNFFGLIFTVFNTSIWVIYYLKSFGKINSKEKNFNKLKYKIEEFYLN